MKIVATIEARMTSTRLPGKVLLPAAGKPMLLHLIDRLRAVPSLSEVVLATTTNTADDPLAALAATEGIRCFRGSEDDVLGRVIGAAESAQADVVVEITGDCPIIDPDLVEQTIQAFLTRDAAYVTNCAVSSYPDGMNTQVFRLETLKRSGSMTDDPLDREHVTKHIREHPELFPAFHLVAPPALRWPELFLTLDEPNDYELLKRIIEHFGEANPLFNCSDVIQLLRRQPELVEINCAVARR